MGVDACPNCDVSLPARVARAAVGAVVAVTLMACYGAPGYGEPAAETTDPFDACDMSLNLVTDVASVNETGTGYSSNALQGSCVGAGSEQIYRYDPGPNTGLAGTLTITWHSDSPAFGVYLQSSCNGAELACGAPSFDGTLSLVSDDLQPLTLVIDTDEVGESGAFDVTVSFEPCPAGGCPP